MPRHAASWQAGAGNPSDGVAGALGGSGNGTARPVADRKWPRWARLLITLALLPVWAAVILAAENDFAFIGSWFDPLVIALMIATVIAAWLATGRTQR
jgi:hypothetical protein